MISDANLSPLELRHLLHQNPELMFQEFETTRVLFDNLKHLTGIKIHRPLETGLVVEYTVNDKPYILFRADIDALPIKEQTNYSFSSKNNFMHACGHDVHTSILYGFINYVVDKKFNQNIIFIFQPAEEGGGGAEKIIKSGILNGFNIKNAFALHVTDDYDFGTIASTPGILFASSVEIDIKIKGKASHVAFPEKGIDGIKVLRRYLDQIDKIISDSQKPVLFGCGKVSAGNVRNILAENATAECTLRTLSVEISKEILNKFKDAGKLIENDTDAKIELMYNAFYTEVNNDSELYTKVSKWLMNKYNFIDCGLKMTAEDFGFFTKRYPSFMFWLGTSLGEKFGLHTPYFLPDDKIIQKGIEIYSTILDNYQTNKNQ